MAYLHLVSCSTQAAAIRLSHSAPRIAEKLSNHHAAPYTVLERKERFRNRISTAQIITVKSKKIIGDNQYLKCDSVAIAEYS